VINTYNAALLLDPVNQPDRTSSSFNATSIQKSTSMIFADIKKTHSPGPFIILFFLVFCTFIPASVTAQFTQEKAIPRIFLVDTHGYASGQLSRIERENMFNRALNETYVGQLLLGNDSGSFISYGGFPLGLDNNPWPFCIDEDDFEIVESFIGKDVIIEFKTPRNSKFLSCSAIAVMISIDLVEDDYSHNETYLEGDLPVLGIDVAYGMEYGRITNAVKNKNTRREYHLTLQVGGRGNKFSHFVLTDHDLYDFAVTALKTAAMVKVHYKSRLNSQQARNRLLIKAIEIVDSNNED